MPSSGGSERYRVRDLVVDVTGASVSRGGERIVLPPRTFELLVALVRRYPATVRRRDLLDAVWPDEHVTDQTLSHRVMVLRKALGDHAEIPVYVGGERGFGYRLVAPVDSLGGLEKPGSTAEVALWPGPRIRTAAAVALLAAAALFGARAAWSPSSRPQPQAPGSPTPTPARPAEDEAAREARFRRLCLRGEFLFLTFTNAGLRHSAESWEQAVILAPHRARAHAGRALTASVRALLDLVSASEAERLARDSARRALELDPASAEAQLAASLVRLLFDRDPAGAAAVAQAASGRDPEDVRGPVVLGLALLASGRFDDGERVLAAGALQDPNAPAIAYLEGRAWGMRARWTEAATAYGRALALEPDLAAARRDNAESLAAAGRHGSALRLLAAGRSAAETEAGAPSDAWRQLCRDGAASLETVQACLLGGDAARAERVLAAAARSRAPSVVLAPHDALLRPLLGGPAMRALSEQLNVSPTRLEGP